MQYVEITVKTDARHLMHNHMYAATLSRNFPQLKIYLATLSRFDAN